MLARVASCATRSRGPALTATRWGRRASTAWHPGCAARSLSYVAPKDTAEGRRRRQSFWRKWGDLTQQEFWQEVGFDQDRTNDNRLVRLPTKKRGKPDKAEYVSKEERNMSDDEYFMATDAMNEGDDDDYYYEDEEYDPADEGERRTRFTANAASVAAAQRSQRAQGALLGASSLEPSRRAELLELLEDLGPEGLQAPPPMPTEKIGATVEDELLMPDLSRNLVIARSFADSLQLRDAGRLPDGAYFGYLLNTRRVTKSGAEGKRISFSTLVVVGNGKGTAGVGMGKDIEAGNAMYKASVDARKNLFHVQRFDNRTLFHAIEDRFAKTKLVLRLRRPGSGTRCSWTVWKILSAFGITDVSVKIHGSRNPTTVAYAVCNALQRATSAQQDADLRGRRVLDMHPDEIRVPGYPR